MEEKLEEEFLCIICYELPKPTVDHSRVTACCGQIICRGCFNQICHSNRGNQTGCPYCRAKLRSHDNKFVERVLHKIHDNRYESETERQRRHSAPAGGGEYQNEQGRHRQRYPTIGTTGKFYCGRTLGPDNSHHTSRDCCQGECSGRRCGPKRGCNCSRCMIEDKKARLLLPDTLVNRDGRTATQGRRGGFYCGRPMDLTPSPSNWTKDQEMILAEIEDPDEAREVAQALALSLQIGPSRGERCREDSPCQACSCLSNHCDDYL